MAWRRSLGGLPQGIERRRVLLERSSPAHDLNALRRVAHAQDIHAQPEPVKQLRTQIALLRIHRANEHEASGVCERHTLTLHGVDPHRSRIEQRVDQMVVEQVDFVDVEDGSVGRRKKARLEDPLAVFERVLEVKRSDEPVLGGRDRQLDDASVSANLRERAGLAALTTFDAPRSRV